MASWQPHDITILAEPDDDYLWLLAEADWYRASCSCGWLSPRVSAVPLAEILGADHQGSRLLDHVADRLVREHGDTLKKLGEE